MQQIYANWPVLAAVGGVVQVHDRTRMKATLAIYDALMQAQIPAPAARGVAEALERDMEALLATKTDLRLLDAGMQRQFAEASHRFDETDRRLAAIDERMRQLLDQSFAREVYARFEQMDQRFEQSDKRFAAIDERMRQLLDQSFAREVYARFEQSDKRCAAIEERMRQLLDQDFAREINERFRSVELALTMKLGSLIVASVTALAAVIKFI